MARSNPSTVSSCLLTVHGLQVLLLRVALLGAAWLACSCTGTEVGNPIVANIYLSPIDRTPTEVGIGRQQQARFLLTEANLRLAELQMWTRAGCEESAAQVIEEVALSVNLVDAPAHLGVEVPRGDYCRARLVTAEASLPGLELAYQGDAEGRALMPGGEPLELIATGEGALDLDGDQDRLDFRFDPGIALAVALDAAPSRGTGAARLESVAASAAMALFRGAIPVPAALSSAELSKRQNAQRPLPVALKEDPVSLAHVFQTTVVLGQERNFESSDGDRYRYRGDPLNADLSFEDSESGLVVRLSLNASAARSGSVVPATLRVQDTRSGRSWAVAEGACSLSVKAPPPIVQGVEILQGSGRCLEHLGGRLLPTSPLSDGVVEVPNTFFFRAPLGGR